MLEIQGINADKVRRYGKQFLGLIRNTHRQYESIMQQQEDRPQDPNHQNVIDISSDNESDDYGEFDELGVEDGSQEERSSYFQPTSAVDAFNAQCWSSIDPNMIDLCLHYL